MRAWPCLVLLLHACAGEARSTGGVDLQVLVRTDLAVGLEFAWVEIALPERGLTSRVPAVLGSYLQAREVAFLTDLPPTRHRYLKVSLLDRRGEAVLSRPMVFEHDRRMAVVARLSRTCREHDCPEACHGGRCVDPGCIDGTEVGCMTDPVDPTPEPMCVAADECPSAEGCARPLCDEGVCWFSADDTLCEADELCAPDGTCVARPEPPDGGLEVGASEDDGGVFASDAGVGDDASVSDGGEDASVTDDAAVDATVDAGDASVDAGDASVDDPASADGGLDASAPS
ncbi:MAG: hypothetical protein H6722_33015 [Sandaracinus sp.]|nr:hypothetical protein [Sandaracinus sp.]